jgi:hypothetical protein
MLEQKCTLIEAANGLKAGMFIYIHGYVNKYGEKQNVTVHADASYERTHQRSAEKLDALEKDEKLSFEIVRNAWVDAQGLEYNRKAKGRTLKESIKEVITIKDKDFAEAVSKVRKGIIDPKKVTDNFEKVANSTYDNAETGKTYLRNVLIHNKFVVKQGEYPVSCSERVNVISDAIREMLPVGGYRTYVLDDETVNMPDGSKEPRFEYIALMGDQVSSSSSSEDN